MRIDAERLQTDLEELGEIGYTEGEGVTRLALDEADLEAREWFKDKLREAGLSVEVDAAANVIGRLEASEGDRSRTVVIGSHLDTVPQGGKFDGALGIVAGLECARILRENDVKLPWNLEVINFTDEESHHFAGTFGSRAMMGLVDESELHKRKAEGIPTLAEDLTKLGLNPNDIGEARRDSGEFRAYFELHIEQGGRLEARGLDVAAVTGIVGIYRYVVEVLGETNHAGTTPMEQRSDALVQAAPVFGLVPEWARARSPEMVGTVGQVDVEPGAVNVIPGRCRFTVELRSLRSEDMARVRDRLKSWLDENVEFELECVLEKNGVMLDDELIGLVLDAAIDEDYEAVRMASGAGHDAQSFAHDVPTGMIFIPSRGGLSHCPEEYSKPEWVVAGAQTLLTTVMKLAKTESGS